MGLATPGNAVEIPIMGDLSRQHARVRREDGYVIEPLQTVRVNGRLIRVVTNLSDGDEIELGESVRLRFRQPHALERHRAVGVSVAALHTAFGCRESC